MAELHETTDGKVTLAIIGTKLDLLITSSNEMRIQMDAIRSCQDRWAYIPGDVGDMKKKIDVLETDVESLKTQTKIIGGLSGLGNIIAGIVGSLFNPRM